MRNPHSASPLSRGGEKHPFIPYKKELPEKARELRNNVTKAEEKLWHEVLRNKQFLGFRFVRQKPLKYFIADFYCAKLMLVIEVDGSVHNKIKERDAERTEILKGIHNIKVVRYTNENILKRIGWVKESLEKEIIQRETELSQ